MKNEFNDDSGLGVFLAKNLKFDESLEGNIPTWFLAAVGTRNASPTADPKPDKKEIPMSKINHSDLHSQFLATSASNATVPSGGTVSTDPRRTIQAIQSGVVAKAAVNELNRALSFANAIGQNFAAVLPKLSEQTRIEVVAALACAASSKDRRAVMEHPLCPAEVEEIVVAYDAAKTEEAEARKADRAAEREQKERAKFEELRRKFEGGTTTEAVSAG